MKKLITAITVVALGGGAFAPMATASPQPLIVGGQVDASADVGWIAALTDRGRYACSGSLVAPRFVLTAGHCTLRGPARNLTVRLDSKDRAEGGVVRRVARVLSFPGYRPFDAYGDMALLRLRRPVAVEPVRLVRRGTHWVGQSGYVAGWGQTSANDQSHPRLLQSASIPIRPGRVCRRTYGRRGFDGSVMLCAGNRSISTCAGDSGGPLARSVNGAWRLVGVTSFVKPTCDRPGGYAWVGSKPLRRWLRKWLGR